MKNIRELFGEGALSGEEFESLLEREGLVLMDAVEGGYVPASRERELEEKFSAERQGFEKTLAEQRARSALKLELTRRGAHNPNLAAVAIGLDGLGGDEAELTSAAARKVASLMESEPYMFASGEASAVVSTGAPHARGAVDTDSMSDADYYRYVQSKEAF